MGPGLEEFASGRDDLRGRGESYRRAARAWGREPDTWEAASEVSRRGSKTSQRVDDKSGPKDRYEIAPTVRSGLAI